MLSVSSDRLIHKVKKSVISWKEFIDFCSMEIKEIFTFYGPSKSPTTTTTYIHTTKDSLAPLFYLQQCSSRWANPPCYRVIELLMDFVSSYQKEIRQIFTIKQKYYQTAGFWVLLHSHLNSFRQKGWDGCELLVLTFLKSAFE